MFTFRNLFFLFMFYSIVGWILEVLNSVVQEHKFVNRGFLIGPYCPIYGFGCVMITICLWNNTQDFVGLFLKSVFICSVLEYVTSYLMEKIFKYRWWDYSNRRFNINGIICLETMIPFGLGACLIAKVINPFLFKVIGNMNETLSLVLFIVLLVIILIDTVFSNIFVYKISKVQKNTKTDSTEELKAKMIEFISKGRTFYKRIFDSFPDLRKSK